MSELKETAPHDPLCPRPTGGDCDCSAGAKLGWDQEEDARTAADIKARLLADLRAKVDDLRERASQGQGDGYMRNEHRVGQEYAYEEVLALIDEAAP